jgi:putative transposase
VTKAVLERALAEEMTGTWAMTARPGRARQREQPQRDHRQDSADRCGGRWTGTVSRYGNGTFEPQIARKGPDRLEGFSERIIAPYARGMTTRDIRAHLREMHDADVSAT